MCPKNVQYKIRIYIQGEDRNVKFNTVYLIKVSSKEKEQNSYCEFAFNKNMPGIINIYVSTVSVEFACLFTGRLLSLIF